MQFVAANIFTSLWEKIENNWLDYLWAGASVILVFIIAHYLTKLVKTAIMALLRRQAKKIPAEKLKKVDTASTLLTSIAKYVIYFIAIAVALGQLGLGATMNSMLATAGIGGIAIAFGAQSLVKDIVTGLFILFEDQFSVGDFVKIGDIQGTVTNISVRTTSVQGVRGDITIIPNGNIGSMTNYSRAAYFANIEARISYAADHEKALAIMVEEAKRYRREHDYVIGEPLVPGIVALDESGVTLRVQLQVKPLKHIDTERALYVKIKERFEKEGVDLPYQRIVVYQGGEKKNDRAL